jgi:hypothetical protein
MKLLLVGGAGHVGQLIVPYLLPHHALTGSYFRTHATFGPNSAKPFRPGSSLLARILSTQSLTGNASSKRSTASAPTIRYFPKRKLRSVSAERSYQHA